MSDCTRTANDRMAESRARYLVGLCYLGAKDHERGDGTSGRHLDNPATITEELFGGMAWQYCARHATRLTPIEAES